jgi:hypothetical protein
MTESKYRNPVSLSMQVRTHVGWKRNERKTKQNKQETQNKKTSTPGEGTESLKNPSSKSYSHRAYRKPGLNKN